MTFDQFNKKYKVLTETNITTSDPLFYETYGSHLDDLKQHAQELANKHGTQPYQHIWTRVDGDSGKLILLSGWHACNRIDYCLTELPWGTGKDSDKDIYIEVDYED